MNPSAHGAPMTSTKHRPHRPSIAPSTRGHIAEQLDREWDALLHRREHLDEVRSWACPLRPLTADVLRSISSLDDLIEATHARHGELGNTLLGELVGRSPTSALAGRIVVQRLLPALLTGVSRYGQLCPHPDRVSEAVGALWIAIASYDVDQRPRAIAASLVSDTMWNAFRMPARRLSAGELPAEPRRFIDTVATDQHDALVEFAHVVRLGRASGVGEADLDVLIRLVRHGSPAAVAALDDVSTRTVRTRRAQAVARLRESIGVFDDAA